MNHFAVHALPYFLVSRGWRTAFWCSYGVWIAGEIWLLAHDRQQVRAATSDRGSRRLLAFLLVSSLLGAFSFSYRSYFGQIPIRPQLVVAIGITLMWAGIGFRAWSFIALGKYFRTSVILQTDHAIVEAGPYRLLRNPSYTGLLLTLAGVGIAIGNWVSLALLIIGPLIGLAWRIHVEDAALASHFGGSYEIYRTRTWSLIPWVW